MRDITNDDIIYNLRNPDGLYRVKQVKRKASQYKVYFKISTTYELGMVIEFRGKGIKVITAFKNRMRGFICPK